MAEPRDGSISRILPDLDDDLLVRLFHKGARAQWTSQDLDFDPPPRLTERQRVALARLLTPVYFGEQTAMAGASGILPQLMRARETSAQVYLASFIMDEARHFEALTRLYGVLGHDPLGLREMPELLQYHHRLRQGDRADWVWGILISDVIAKHFYRAFGLAQPDPLWSDLSQRILRDESRHLAFAEHYLRRNVQRMLPARRQSLLGMRDDLFRLLEAMTERVRADAAQLDVDADAYLEAVSSEVTRYATRVGLTGSGSDPPPQEPPAAERDSAPRQPPSQPPAAEQRSAPRQPPYERSATEQRSGPREPSSNRQPPYEPSAIEQRSGPREPSSNRQPPYGPSAAEQRSAPREGGRAEPERSARLPDCFACVLTVLCGRRLVRA